MKAYIFASGVVIGILSILQFTNPNQPWWMLIILTMIGVGLADWNSE